MDAFTPLLAAVALVWKIVDFAKQVRVRDVDSIVTQLATWGAGVLVVFVLANSDFGDGIRIANGVLGHFNAWSLVLVGLSIGATGSVAYDFKRAFDRTDSAAQPSLVSGAVPVPLVATVAASEPAAVARKARRPSQGDAIG